jgi:subtilisin-like proprotein convertase family protein
MNRKSIAAGLILAAAATAPVLANTDGTFTFGPGPGGLVPDASGTGPGPSGQAAGVFTSVINVPGLSSVVSLNSVSLTWGPAHTWAGDIQVTLTAPNGDNVHLHSRVGATGNTSFGDSSDLLGTYVFVDADAAGGVFSTAAAAAGAAVPIAPGTYKRSTNAATPGQGVDTDDYDVFVGDQANGNWTLTVRDWASPDPGTLASWSLNLTIDRIPAPGALALLGVAGLAGRNRRRRA